MKVNRLETHDRLDHFVKQEFDIGACCQDLINQRPFGDYPFYIFAHARTLGIDEKFTLVTSGKFRTIEEVPEKTIIWQPRLTKPKAQTNSMLFKGYPGSDNIKIIWIIPAKELWEQFKKENMMANETICESIHDFQNNRGKLEEREEDDLPDSVIDALYREIAHSARNPKKFEPIL
jgi:hypothetical protein